MESNVTTDDERTALAAHQMSPAYCVPLLNMIFNKLVSDQLVIEFLAVIMTSYISFPMTDVLRKMTAFLTCSKLLSVLENILRIEGFTSKQTF